jgi:hypothetical protein
MTAPSSPATSPERLSPELVASAPELLVLASLDTTLWTLHLALVAAFPELIDELGRRRDRPVLRAARLLVDRSSALRRAAARYRRALAAERERHAPDDDDLLF